MLVLSRRIGQAITVGHHLTITVVGNARGTVKLGIDAPRDIPVLRNEVIERQTTKEIRQPMKGGVS